MNKQRRYKEVKIRLTDEEFDYLKYKQELSGIKSQNEFMKRLIFEDMILKIKSDEYREFIRLIRNMENNINQIIRVGMRNGMIDEETTAKLQNKQEEIWQQLKSLGSSKLSVMR